MSKESEDASHAFAEFLAKQRVAREKLCDEIRTEAAREETDELDARKAYRGWRATLSQNVEPATRIIADWVAKFVASPAWREILSMEPPVQEVRISDTVEYAHPSLWHHGIEERSREYFYLDRDGGLFVHECVKYGKSYPIHTFALMLQHAAPPVIMAVAESVTQDRILAIISADLEKSFSEMREQARPENARCLLRLWELMHRRKK